MSTNIGTALPVHTHSDLWQVEVIGLGETPREREKASPEGEVTYSTGCILRMRRKDGTIAADKAASVNVIKQAAIYELGVIYKAQGRIYVQPWESNGRMTLSITVEGLVPADATAGASRSSKSEAA
ncbi:hypothetical protein FOE78_02715 [Microlunatus elymi]|uniref:Single-stranded DNA-binding protein n=1 Tax=Microlunatus elymi TaxID=2596828 RepID=A0A516PVJ8_9ACTN|nr:hypothetical protein [Microlunatus elymi]QDP94971.1 hypothetical protein FOE78_02715 [Microlunatus elymi]